MNENFCRSSTNITAYDGWEYECGSRDTLNHFLTIMNYMTVWFNRRRSVENLSCLESFHLLENVTTILLQVVPGL